MGRVMQQQQQQQQPPQYQFLQQQIQQQQQPQHQFFNPNLVGPYSSEPLPPQSPPCSTISQVRYIVNNFNIVGTGEENCVSAIMEFAVEVFDSKYLLLPVMSQEHLVLSDVSIKGPDDKESMHLVVVNSKYTLLVNAKGLYSVRLNFIVPYSSSIKQAVTFPCLPALDTRLDFSLPDDMFVKVMSCSPVVSSEHVGHKLTAHLPPTNEITIKWISSESVTNTPASSAISFEKVELKKEEPSESEKPKEKEMVVTSSQDILHSIGAGVCVMTLTQTFTVTNGSLSMFRLKVGKHGSADISKGKEWLKELDELRSSSRRLKVVRADGACLKSWDFEGDHLTLTLDSAVEGSCSFTIVCELDLAGTSCHLFLPSLVPLDVNRNKGAIAIQGKSAVEIVEGSEIRGISKVDVAELPSVLQGQPNILLAYKYLHSNYRLCLDTTKHNDVEVVMALCESATYVVTHRSNQLLYDLTFNIKNTQCQYLKILLPQKASLWSATVGGETVKPAVDEAKRTLIPMVKGANVAFTASLIFIAPAPALPSREWVEEDLSFLFPSADLPITHLRCELWLPKSHLYSAFSSTNNCELEEVEVYSDNTYLREVHNVDWYRAKMSSHPKKRMKMKMPVRARREVRMPMTQMQVSNVQLHTNVLRPLSNASCSDDESEDLEEGDSSSGNDDMEMEQYAGAGTTAMGIKPLNISTNSLRDGKSYLFEKLLVPSSTDLGVTCRTCLAHKEADRTAQSDKGPRAGCGVM